MTRRLGDTTPKTDFRTCIRFDAETWDAIHKLADENYMSVSAMTRHLVRLQAKQKELQGATH